MNLWLLLGLAAQFCFFLRFFIQWIESEKKKKIVIPKVFWYLSLAGGIGLLVYSIHLKDPIFIIGQSLGVLIYTRNLVILKKEDTILEKIDL